MSQEFVIDAFVRDDQGKGASRRLRRDENKIPGVIYGAGQDAVAISIRHNELTKAIESESFFSQLLTLNVAGVKEVVIIKDLQRHPYKLQLTHADFQRIDQKQSINVQVPIHLLNEEEAPAVKLEGGVAFRLLAEVEITCLPKDLPSFIEVDLMDLEMDQVIHLSDLKLPEGVQIVAIQHSLDNDQAVVTISLPRAAEVEEDVSEEDIDGEEGSDDEEEGENEET